MPRVGGVRRPRQRLGGVRQAEPPAGLRAWHGLCVSASLCTTGGRAPLPARRARGQTLNRRSKTRDRRLPPPARRAPPRPLRPPPPPPPVPPPGRTGPRPLRERGRTGPRPPREREDAGAHPSPPRTVRRSLSSAFALATWERACGRGPPLRARIRCARTHLPPRTPAPAPRPPPRRAGIGGPAGRIGPPPPDPAQRLGRRRPAGRPGRCCMRTVTMPDGRPARHHKNA